MLIGSTGTSVAADAAAAGREAAQRAWAGLGAAAPKFVVTFTTTAYDSVAVLVGVAEVFGETVNIGCRTAGIMTDAGLIKEGVGVWVVGGDGVVDAFAHMEGGISEQPRALGDRLATAIEPKLDEGADDHTTVLAFADLVRGEVTIDVALRAFLSGLGPGVRVVGAGSGDDLTWRATNVSCNGVVAADSIAAATLRTKGPVGIGIGHGCLPSSRTMIVTRANRNTIEELDGKPALERYREAFPEDEIRAESFLAHGLMHPIGLVQLADEHLLRTPIRVVGDGGLSCAGNVPERSTVTFMRHDLASMLEAARNAARMAKAELGDSQPAAALLFDCATRSILLGDNVALEVAAVREILGPDVAILGMSSYGEIGAGRGPIQFHNQTLVVMLLAAE